jgi:signal transduction histidine kinase
MVGPPIQVLLIEGNPTDALPLRQALARVSCPPFAEEEVRRLNEELEQRVIQRTAQLEASNRDLAPEIAARQRSEEVMRTLNTALEQRVAELNAANQELEAFSYSISHDLRAPLRAIHSYACILLEDYAPQLEAEAQQYVPRVSENALRMGQLVDALLTFARLGHELLRIPPVAPTEFVRQALKEYR